MNKYPKTFFEKIKFYFGYCECGGKVKRWSWPKAYCSKCDKTWRVSGL